AAHATSGSAVLSERMMEPATATLTSSVNPAIAGVDVALTATIAASGGQTPTGTVVFTQGGQTIATAALNNTGVAVLHTSALSVGQDAITAIYAGDSNVAAASASLTVTIVSATTQVSLSSNTQLATYGSAISLSATVTSNGIPPTGHVTFTDNGAAIGSAAVDSDGGAALAISTLSPGTHNVVAEYAGDAHSAAASSTAVTIVVKQTTSLSVASSADPGLTVSPITLTATVVAHGGIAASGAVSFSDGSNLLGPAALNGNGVASLTVPSWAAGIHSITASYAGDEEDFASTSSALSEVINLRASTTTLSGSHTDASNPQAVTLIAVVQASGPSAASGTVSFSTASLQMGTAPVDANSIATLTILLDQSNSAENIIAQYSGDAVYAGSSSAAAAVQAAPATQFTLAIDPPTLKIATTQHTAVALTLESIAGFNDTIQLGCLGLPFAATCTFSAPQTKLAAGGSTNVQLTIDTGDPLGMGAQTSAKVRSSGHGVLLCGVPAVLLISLLRRRRKLAYAWLSLVCVAFMVSGCSGLHGASTPPGTYTFKVTASGQGSGATQSQVVTLTVTQ
ncbi:MAG TPA: Ig-like domain-containing protein, partial [Gemmatimonadaceae bacterium]